jgi:hypothetical protein
VPAATVQQTLAAAGAIATRLQLARAIAAE